MENKLGSSVNFIKRLHITHIKHRQPQTKAGWIVAGIIALLLMFFLYDSFRLSVILVKNSGESEQNAQTVPPTPADAGQVCEYKDVDQKTITEPDKNDKIQKNIGYQNNKVGLYIYAEVGEFTDLAAELANSNGGDWGYALIPYNVKDYDENRWGKLFTNLNNAHLIPIIQLWDLDLDNNKRDEQIKKSAEFLNSLPWPIQKRYISVYNEPNDAKFWKGDVNPEQYADVLNKTIDEFKSLDKDFFIMNGAFNASARTGGDYLDEESYLIRMNTAVPGIFEKLDGWASHPYPQPNFTGSPNGTGRDSIQAYNWELNILKKHFNIDTNKLPVFITETGWAHRESEASDNGEPVSYKLNQYQAADNFKAAYENVWLKDDKVVAVTPFTIRYDPPHDHFSWITKNNNPYPQFDAVKDIQKVKGKPPVVNYVRSKLIICQQDDKINQ